MRCMSLIVSIDNQYKRVAVVVVVVVVILVLIEANFFDRFPLSITTTTTIILE